MYECSKSNGNIVVMTKNTCYLRLDRVWNIQVETTENSISRFLDFNIFGGSNLPQEIPGGSPLWRSQHFRDIIIYSLKSEAGKAGAMQPPPTLYISWRVIFLFTTIIEASLATYMISGQLSGFPIRYPDFKSLNRFSKGTPGYGVPPRKKNLKDVDKWLLSPKKM